MHLKIYYAGLTPTEASIKLQNSKKIAEKIYGKDVL